jgi:hypothetical protein
MKFDVVLMNPPYDKSLHLKFLEKTIEIADNVVSVQPVRWLQDPVANLKKSSDFNKFKNSIQQHITDLEIIEMTKAVEIFKAGFNADLGIYTIDSNKKNSNIVAYNMPQSILEKVLKHKKKLIDVIENNKLDGWRMQITEIQPITAQGGKKFTYGWFCRFCIYNHLRSTIFYDGYKNNKYWGDYVSGIKPKPGQGIPWSIKFNSKEEAENFENSLKTTFYHYIVYNIKTDQHTPFKFLPFMDDYTKPWTNERFYKEFNLTTEEINIIEDAMKNIEIEMKQYLKA